jgi:outer membrane protein OmpA-like peptidoglycan-associated protein
MSASALEDADDALPLRGADRPVGTTLEIAAGKKSQPKARTKRPRPTFNDGSVTRVFKFPSKAYPRSSYYVTSTEIIIRIKKARKKWKLVIPKKRVAAYRTNRWFAKPRWVEIELTYTQASKLGLVEPRTPSTEITSTISAEQQATRHTIVDSDHTLPGGSASEAEPSSTSTWQRLLELAPNVEQPGRLLNMDHVDFAVDGDHLKEDTVFPSSLPHGGSRVPLLQMLPMADADVCSRQSKSALAAGRPRTDRAAPRARAFLPIALSALGVLGVAAAWITLVVVGSSTTPVTADLACKRSEQSSPCTQAIMTGAIGKVDQPLSSDPRPSAAFATHASFESISAIEQLQLGAPQSPKIATTPTELDDDSVEARNRVAGAVNAAAESDPLPAATTPETSLLLPQNVPADRNDCRELRAASQSINISFDYASSRLNQAILPALESFAVRLRSCPSAKVIIEGHTDSDGRAAWNQSLSVHRAKAVLEHLVYAGVPPSQLSAIGFGQSRPYAPNVSAKNKRSNRRVALVVDVRR